MLVEKKTNRDPLKASMGVCFTVALLVLTSTLAKGCSISNDDRDDLCNRRTEPYCRFKAGKGFAPASNPELIRSCKPCRDIKFCQDRQPYSTVAGVAAGNRNDIQCHTDSANGRQEGRCAMPVRDIKNIRCQAVYYNGSGGTRNTGPELIITWSKNGWNEVHMHMQRSGNGQTYHGVTAKRNYKANIAQTAQHSAVNFRTYRYLYDACERQASAEGFTMTYGSSRRDFLPADKRKPVVTTQVNRIIDYIFF